MAAKRKRHVQQQLFRRGGKRRGAGRKPKGARAGEGHDARPAFKPYHGLHVVMRVVPAVGSLRRRAMYKAMRDATITAALRERFRIVHISLQRNHVHLLVEAEHKAALARYCLGNWRHHGEDQAGLPSTWLLDPFSSAISFPDRAGLAGQPWMWPIRETYDPLMVRRPQTWLLREGWKIGGRSVGTRSALVT